MNRKTKRKLKPVVKGLRMFALITLSLLALLPSFTVKADEREVYSNPHFALEINRDEVNNLKLSAEVSSEEVEIQEITLVSDNGTRITEKAVKNEQGSYNVQFAVGKNGNFKIEVKYSFDALQKSISVDFELKYDTYQEQMLEAPKEDIESSSEFLEQEATQEVAEVETETPEEEKQDATLPVETETEASEEVVEDEPNADSEETKLPWMNMRTGEVTYYSDEEIETFNAQARASGILTVPNKFQAQYRIDSYSGGWQGTKYTWGVAYIDGDYAVCLDPTREAGHGNNYLSEGFFDSLPDAQQDRIWLINYFGIGFEGDTNPHRFFAQQELTWEEMTIEQVRGYGGNEKFQISWTGSQGEDLALINQYKTEIQSLMSTYYTRPSFHNVSYDVKIGDTLTLTDTNNVLERFDVTVPSGVELISKSGNTFQVRITSKDANGQDITFSKKYQPSATTTTAWGYGDAQKVFTAGRDKYDPLESWVSLNFKAGNLDLGKRDTNNVIYAGVEFELSKDKSSILQTLTTKANGRVLVEGLDEGNYFVREKKVPINLVINTEWVPLTITAGETTTYTAVNDIKPSLILGKQDTEGTWYANIDFEYSYDKVNILGNIKTGANGKTAPIENLNAGTIYVREVNVTKPLIVDTEWKAVTLKNNETASYTAVNEIATWQFSLHKQDEHGKGIAVTFDVYDDKGVHTGTLSTDTNGDFLSGKLPLGSVTLVEKYAPAGVVLDKTPIKLTGTYKDQHTSVVLVSKTVTNFYRDFDITLLKLEDDSDVFNPELHGQTIEGVKLAYKAREAIYEGSSLIYKAGDLVGEALTNAEGKVFFKELPAGKYRIEELATVEGYQLHDGYWDMDVEYTGSDATVSVVQVGKTLTNTPIYGGVELVKANGTATERLEGGVFELYYHDKLLGTYTSDKDGRIVVNGLRHSTGNAYSFKEIKSPWGYWINEEPIYFDISTQGEMVYLIAPNNLIEVHVEWNKINEEFLPLCGVGFGIRSVETNEFVTLRYADGKHIVEESVWYTDENGEIFTRGMLTAGEYELVEVAPLEGYQPIAPKRFTVDENQTYIDLGSLIGLSLDAGEIVNYWNRGDIQIGKYDPELDIYLPNFGFNLYDIDNNLLGYYETDSDGFVTIPNLKYGLYDIEEIKVDGEYLLNPSQKRERIFVEEHEKTYTVIFENVQPKGKLEGLKLDYKDNTGVQGAEYGLYTLEEELEQSTFTDENGKFIFEGFRLGKYYVQEIATVDGYRIDDTKYYVDFEYADEHTAIILQTLIVEEMRVPEIQTEAAFVERDKEDPNIVTLVDHVHYENLVLGKEYTVEGILMNPETGLPILINGDEVTGSTTFIADKHDGIVDVIFTFDASKLETRKVVVFEDLLEEGTPMAFHHDLKDIHQTVEIPEIETEASFTERDEKDANIVTLTDTVSYSGFVVGKEYVTTAILMDPNTGLPTLIDGKEITGSTTFTPTETSGIVDVTVTFDASKLETNRVVFFERTTEEDRLIALHTDINDVKQTVELPEVGTTLSFSERDKNEPNIVTLTDEVRYSGLVVGKEYTVNGKLMDGHIGEAILIDGQEVTGSTTFIPTETAGTVHVDFVFDQNKLLTNKVVAFEEVREGERLIAVHADINDIDQTIDVITYRILKKDAISKIVLDEAEFTRWDQDGNILEVKKTDENGVVEFKLFYGEINTAKETDAPVGYVLSDEIVTMDTTIHEDGTLFEIEYYNDLLPIVELPGAGYSNTNLHLGMFVSLLGLILLLAAILRKRFAKEDVITQVLFVDEPFYSEIVKEDASQEHEFVSGVIGSGHKTNKEDITDLESTLYVEPDEKQNE
ncbi:VaFE repeat-containing surface-anchored protein [Erysipelothrix sp. HDW6A]|uniref:SpaA isopeptide-forming pilin-related protein n=1 Tax=Erysipelothrix sp. HDW6A TaxID=2714928 RepID=UPI00140A9FBE|nr:SpaA isopeptide-forming pilin-related protein [Erysipelothrix sp. HDW6A]QIK57006.1 VaFE repeat-containing surface-anchored protein [Erysipelothrix sp. HDW6A]